MVFDCKLASGKDIYCSILIEHNSCQDPYVAFQLGNYLFAAYRVQIKVKQPLKVILALLFCQHNQDWKFRSVNSFFEDFLREMQQFAPRFDRFFI